MNKTTWNSDVAFPAGTGSLSWSLWNIRSAARESLYQFSLFLSLPTAVPIHIIMLDLSHYSHNAPLPSQKREREIWNSFNFARKIGGIWREVLRNRITEPPCCALKTIDWRLASVADWVHKACLACLFEYVYWCANVFGSYAMRI